MKHWNANIKEIWGKWRIKGLESDMMKIIEELKAIPDEDTITEIIDKEIDTALKIIVANPCWVVGRNIGEIENLVDVNGEITMRLSLDFIPGSIDGWPDEVRENWASHLEDLARKIRD